MTFVSETIREIGRGLGRRGRLSFQSGGEGGLGRRLRSLDLVWLATAGLFLSLALFAPEQLWPSITFTADSFTWILPFLLVSVALAAWLKAAGADQMISSALCDKPVKAILIASIFGAFSPFCSCGVVPLAVALLGAGMPLSAVMAFWLASPLMDPEMFVLMLATPGLPVSFTLAKVVAALAMGLFAGFATLALEKRGVFPSVLRPGLSGGCGTAGIGPASVRWAFWKEAPRRRAFYRESKTVGLFLAKWMVLAFAIESLMVAWIPGDLVSQYLGSDGWASVPLAVAVGVPAYLNGYAAIPLVGELMNLGMSPAAGLTFMIAGGITSLPASMAVFAVVRGRVFSWYLVLAGVGALLIGWAAQLLF
ncbi:MAG: permease [Pseudomonadota bacterium]